MRQPAGPAIAPTTNTYATLALVVGPIGLLTSLVGSVGGLPGFVAFCLGVAGERRARRDGAPGEKMALAGILFGLLAVVLALGWGMAMGPRVVMSILAPASLSWVAGCAIAGRPQPNLPEPPIPIKTNDTLFLDEVFAGEVNGDAFERSRVLGQGHQVCGIVWSYGGSETRALAELVREGVQPQRAELIARAALAILCRDGPIRGWR